MVCVLSILATVTGKVIAIAIAIALMACLMMLVRVVTALVRCVLLVLSNGLFQRRAFAFGGHRGDDDGSEQGAELAVTVRVIESRSEKKKYFYVLKMCKKTKMTRKTKTMNYVFVTSATKLTTSSPRSRIQIPCFFSL
jgi:hypothetical protein